MQTHTGGSSSNEATHVSTTNFAPSTQLNYLQNDEARAALMRGVHAVNDAVKLTIGPKGKDAVLGAFEWPYSIATNDGASIAEKVKSEDPFEQMGVRLLQEAIGRANEKSGDGSTTTCVLTAAILEEGQKYVHLKDNMKDSLNACLPFVLESLKEQTKEVKPEDVWKVAAVSAQDEEMGKMIGEIYTQIGKDGVIDWDNSYDETTSYVIKDGVELKGVTYAHRSMVNASPEGLVANPFQGDRIIVSNPKILISAEKINTAQQLDPYLKSLAREKINEMVLFCDEIEPMALAELEALNLGINIRTGQPLGYSFKVVVLKAPTMWKDWVYEDFALMTGATIFGVGGQANFKGAASLSWLGTCEKLIARRGGTDIIGTKDISDHIATLTDTSKERQEFAKRVEWLNSKTATVKMGARSEVELTYKRLKFDDAKNAAKLALKGGIVLGGGYSLANIDFKGETVGEKILKAALKAPMLQIEYNAQQKLDKKKLEKDEVYDPALVVQNAVKAAISVAGTVLNCETLIPYDHERKYQ